MTTIWSNDDYGQEYTPKVKANELGYSDYVNKYEQQNEPQPSGSHMKTGHISDEWWWKHFKWESGFDQDFLTCKKCGADMYVESSWKFNNNVHDVNLDNVATIHLKQQHNIDEFDIGESKANEVHGSDVNGYDAKEFKNFCLACAGRGFMYPTGAKCPNCNGTGVYDSERDEKEKNPPPPISRDPNHPKYSPLSDQEPRTAGGSRLYEAQCEDCSGTGMKTIYNKHRVRAGDDGSFRAGHFRPDYQLTCQACKGIGYNVEARPKDKRQTQIFNAPPENLARIGNLKQEDDPDWTTTPDPSGHTWNEFGQKEKTSRSNYTQYHDRPRAKAEQDANRGDIEHDSLEDPLSWYSSEDIMPLSELNEASTEIQDIYPADPSSTYDTDGWNAPGAKGGYNMTNDQYYYFFYTEMKEMIDEIIKDGNKFEWSSVNWKSWSDSINNWTAQSSMFATPASVQKRPEVEEPFRKAHDEIKRYWADLRSKAEGTMPSPSWESDTVKQMTGHTGEANDDYYSQSDVATKYEFWKKYNTNGTMQEWINYAQNQGLEKEVAEIEWELNQESGDEVKYGDREKEHLDKMKEESDEDLSIDLKPKTEDDISQSNKDYQLLEQFRD